MQDLEEELKNPNHSKAEIAAIQRKYDLKMTVYIYTSLIAGQKHQAKQALSSWKGRPNLQNILLRAGLLVRTAAGQRQRGRLPGAAGAVLK